MTISASDIPAAADLLKRRAQLISRKSRINEAQSLGDMAALFAGTGLEGAIIALARDSMGQFMQVNIDALERQITAMGVELGA